MSKPKITLIFALIILILFGIGAFFYFHSEQNTLALQQNRIPSGQQNLQNGGVNSSFPTGSESAPITGTISNPLNTSTSTRVSGSTNSMQPSLPLAELRQISQTPTAGGIAFTQGTSTIIRFMERSTGHISQTTTTSLLTERLTDTRIPAVYEGDWLKNGQGLYVRYQDASSQNIDTYYATIKALSAQTALQTALSVSATSSNSAVVEYAPDELSGQLMPSNITSLALSPSGNSVFYLQTTASGSQGTTATITGTQKTPIFSSVLNEWIAQWASANVIALTTKASINENGYLYFLNPSSGTFTKILGDIAGLTTLISPDGSSVLLSSSQKNGEITTYLYTISTGNYTQLPTKTLPTKCVWSTKNISLIYCGVPEQIPSGNYPDDWYQGNVSFTDDFMSINLKTATTTLLAVPSALINQNIDATNLFLSPKEDFLFFLNKKDGTLWSLSLAK
jgi:hypothetical protein